MSQIIDENEDAINTGLYEPALWFMKNDPNSDIVMDDTYSAIMGSGITIKDWTASFVSMYYWNPNANITIMHRNDLSKKILTNDVNVGYILSTHDLTEYFQLIQNFQMNVFISPMKSQDEAEWTIYKVK
jgi:hypothetical protein